MPTRWPAAAIDPAVPGYASAQRPWMKQVVRSSRPVSRPSSVSVASAVAGRSWCSTSKVSATRNGADRRERRHLSMPVTTRPRVKNRWVSRNAMTGMTIVMSVPAWISPGSR